MKDMKLAKFIPVLAAVALYSGLVFAQPVTGGGMGTAGQGATSAALSAIAAAAGPFSWSKAQRGTPSVITISTSTFTPSFDAANNFGITLVHASCPCTLANPSTTPVAGQSGVLVITQSATGSDTIGTWGSLYVTAGGTSTITLSTAAGVSDVLPYYVQDATHIVLGALIAGPTH